MKLKFKIPFFFHKKMMSIFKNEKASKQNNYNDQILSTILYKMSILYLSFNLL